MSTFTQEQRRLRGQLGAHRLHSRYDSRDLTANARAAFLDTFEQQVDPDRILDPAERARRAEHARKAHFVRLALASSTARAERKRKRLGALLVAVMAPGRVFWWGLRRWRLCEPWWRPSGILSASPL